MIALFRLSFRNTLRNRRRSGLTAATVMIGTAFVVVTLSFLNGIFGGMIDSWTTLNGPVRVVTTAYAEREMLMPLHENIELVEPLLSRVRNVPGVASAEPLLRTGVVVSKGEEIGEDVALMVGASDAWYRETLLPTSTLSRGGFLTPNSKDEEVVVGAKVARDLAVSVGDEILVMGTTQYGSMAPISAKVVGVLSGNASIDVAVFVSLDTARWMVDLPDGALEVLVYPIDGSESGVQQVQAAVQGELGAGYAVDPWYARDIWRDTKPIVDGVSGFFSSLIVFVMALAIFNTMTMSVLERTGEIGVLRAMGQSRASAVMAFLFEAAMIGVFGGLLGIMLGAGPALWLESHGISYGQDVLDEMGGSYPISETMYADLSGDVLLTALLVGLATATLGAFFPALRAARIPPSEAMRAR